MPVDKTTALTQIDAVFTRWDELKNNWYSDNVSEVTTLARAVIVRLSPPGSSYLAQMTEIVTSTEPSLARTKDEEIAFRLKGLLRALRADYEADRLLSFQELVHAELFSDFLEAVEYFLSEGYKDPAAVMAGGVLEQHLRKLCAKHGVIVATKPKLDSMNADLVVRFINTCRVSNKA